jgi:hypothetical protein
LNFWFENIHSGNPGGEASPFLNENEDGLTVDAETRKKPKKINSLLKRGAPPH